MLCRIPPKSFIVKHRSEPDQPIDIWSKSWYFFNKRKYKDIEIKIQCEKDVYVFAFSCKEDFSRMCTQINKELKDGIKPKNIWPDLEEENFKSSYDIWFIKGGSISGWSKTFDLKDLHKFTNKPSISFIILNLANKENCVYFDCCS